jgi:hypothetical protein
MITIPLRLAAAKSSTGGGDRSSQIISPPPKPSVGVAGEPIGVYRPEDRLTLPALTAIIDAGGLRLRAIGERLKYDDQLRVAVLR